MLTDKKVALVAWGREGALLGSLFNSMDPDGGGSFKHGFWILWEGMTCRGKQFDTIIILPISGALHFQERERTLDWLKTMVHPSLKWGGEMIFVDEGDDWRKAPAELIEAIQDDSTSVVG